MLDLRNETRRALSTTDNRNLTWNGTADVRAGTPVLNGGVGYMRRETSGSSTTDALTLRQAPFVVESVTGALLWSPEALPVVEVVGSNDRTWGGDVDRIGTTGTVRARYSPVKQVMLDGSVNLGTARDRLNDVETNRLNESARVTYSDKLGDRTTVYGAYSFEHVTTDTRAAGPGGTVETQRFPVAGYSLVEKLADLPERDTLQTNPALIDGDVVASAGIDLGTGPTLQGDTALRDIGVELAERPSITSFRVRVRSAVDEPLPSEVSSAFSWRAFRSENNRDWTEIPIAGAVRYDLIGEHFDIPIPPTTARYLKVVTRPLAATVSLDPRFQAIRVTEVRVFLVQAAADVRGTQSAYAHNLNGAVGVVLLENPGLRYDLAVSSAASGERIESWNVTNGLSLDKRLSPRVGLTARVSRSDSGSATGGHVADTGYGASLSAEPLPTLAAGASLSGTVSQSGEGNSFNNGVSLFARADLYPGVSANANAGYSLQTAVDGRFSRNQAVAATLSVTPHRIITLTGIGSYGRQTATGGGSPGATTENSRVEATVSSTPVRVLLVAASIARVTATGAPPSVFASVLATYSPLTRGALLLTLSYAENLETATRTRNRTGTASARLQLARFAYVEGGYSLVDVDQAQVDTRARAITARLVVSF